MEHESQACIKIQGFELRTAPTQNSASLCYKCHGRALQSTRPEKGYCYYTEHGRGDALMFQARFHRIFEVHFACAGGQSLCSASCLLARTRRACLVAIKAAFPSGVWLWYVLSSSCCACIRRRFSCRVLRLATTPRKYDSCTCLTTRRISMPSAISRGFSPLPG